MLVTAILSAVSGALKASLMSDVMAEEASIHSSRMN